MFLILNEKKQVFSRMNGCLELYKEYWVSREDFDKQFPINVFLFPDKIFI